MKLVFVRDDDIQHRALAQECRERTAAGTATRVYPGAWLLHNEETTPSAENIMAARAIAAAHSNPTSTVAGVAAAVLHGLPIMRRHLEGPVTLNRAWRGQPNPWHVTTRAELREDEVVTVAGVRCTGLARTVADLAAVLPRNELLACADAAARYEPGLELEPRRRYSQAIKWVSQVMSPRSESFGESVSRGVLLEAGFEWPILQGNVLDSFGGFVARADFAHPVGVLGEYDGRTKYAELRREGESVEDVVMREKQREYALEASGWQLVRWTWAELGESWVLVQRIERALRVASFMGRPRGQVVPAPSSRSPRPDWRRILGLEPTGERTDR